jgi:L-alanine-DL-glutamate epimerase-like enolase superfamily enzyme
MKIVDVIAHHLAIPAKKTGPEVPFVWGRLAQVIVELKTEDGRTGWGECFAYGLPRAVAAVVNHTLKPLLVGEDATAIRPLMQSLFRKTHLYGRYGVTTFALSGVDIALWDLAGKRAGKPLYELLGGAASRRVPAYASLVRYPEEDDRIAAYAKQALREGYTMIKLHQSTPASAALARKAIGADVPLTVDINCQWSSYEAAQMAMALDESGLYWLEEPVWPPEDFAALAEVQSSTGVPIASGENACTAVQFGALIDAEAATFIQPSVIKLGGVSEFLKVAQLVEAANLELAPHSAYFGPGFAATLHLIAHTGRAKWIEKFYFDLESAIFTQPLRLDQGGYTLPEGPGLGVDVDPLALEEYRVKD